ncbi:MAG: cell division topological specificity factor MinE [Deinococcales bacterium]
MFWGHKKGSANTLKNRLQVMLAYDRAGLPPGKEQMLREELLGVLKKYFPNLENFHMDMQRDGEGEAMILKADIPLR